MKDGKLRTGERNENLTLNVDEVRPGNEVRIPTSRDSDRVIVYQQPTSQLRNYSHALNRDLASR
jgi:hypothetical protein